MLVGWGWGEEGEGRLKKNPGPSFALKKNSQDQGKCYYTLQKREKKKGVVEEKNFQAWKHPGFL